MTKYEKLIASCINPYYTEPGEKKLQLLSERRGDIIGFLLGRG